jgi:tRNA nucleotidyltransferase (CCA-adding enzyme)
VPVIEIGTPEQDAFRRDLTINSLFYNINEGKIEDHTGMGINDLKDHILRTPLEPL